MSPTDEELTLNQIIAWKSAKSSTSEFAKSINPEHFVGYTEEELDICAEERDELAKYIEGE